MLSGKQNTKILLKTDVNHTEQLWRWQTSASCGAPYILSLNLRKKKTQLQIIAFGNKQEKSSWENILKNLWRGFQAWAGSATTWELSIKKKTLIQTYLEAQYLMIQQGLSS